MRIADTDGAGSGPPLPPRPRRPAHPVARRAADVAPRSIDWLWKGRIPFGKLTII
ncbi:MAG: hypothetical protein HYX51_01770, partial [Chloroflexi bacterium]|nr:hypothetical protein [Chloroflexota bacterium]